MDVSIFRLLGPKPSKVPTKCGKSDRSARVSIPLRSNQPCGSHFGIWGTQPLTLHSDFIEGHRRPQVGQPTDYIKVRFGLRVKVASCISGNKVLEATTLHSYTTALALSRLAALTPQPTGSNYHPHCNYNSYHWIRTFRDPDFLEHKVIG